MTRQLPAILASLLLAACSADDLTDASSAAHGGSGATTTATSTSTGGAAGAGGGAEGCSEGSVCAPEAPEGWVGPAILHTGANAPADCDAPWMPALTGNTGDVLAPFQCAPCSCTAPTGTLCSAPTAMVYTNGMCTGTPTTKQLAGGCTDFGGGYGTKVTASAPGGGSCTASGGAPMKDDPLWDASAHVCGEAPLGVACEGGHCVAAPPAPYRAGTCVYKDGDNACPDPFTEKTVVYGDVTDTRACSVCGCTAPTGASCAAAVTSHANAACGGSGLPVVADGTCQLGDYYDSFNFDPGAVGGSCGKTGGEPSGDVQPAAPVTVCCTP